MGIAGQVGIEVAGNLARGGFAIHAGIQQAFDDARARREEGVASVDRLSMRLQDARRAQHAAERRAAVAEQELGGALAELRLLREALRHEKAVTGALRGVLGV